MEPIRRRIVSARETKNTISPTPLAPRPFFAYLSNSADALILLELIRSGLYPVERLRPSAEEKKRLAYSGAVYAVSVNEYLSRWTDQINWSYSQISGAYMSYVQLQERTETFPIPDALGCRTACLTQDTLNGPLVKRTLSAWMDGERYRLISYFNITDVRSGLLRPVSDLDSPSIRPILYDLHPSVVDAAKSFRLSPVLEPDAYGRYRYIGDFRSDIEERAFQLAEASILHQTHAESRPSQGTHLSTLQGTYHPPYPGHPSPRNRLHTSPPSGPDHLTSSHPYSPSVTMEGSSNVFSNSFGDLPHDIPSREYFITYSAKPSVYSTRAGGPATSSTHHNDQDARHLSPLVTNIQPPAHNYFEPTYVGKSSSSASLEYSPQGFPSSEEYGMPSLFFNPASPAFEIFNATPDMKNPLSEVGGLFEPLNNTSLPSDSLEPSVSVSVPRTVLPQHPIFSPLSEALTTFEGMMPNRLVLSSLRNALGPCTDSKS